MFNDHHTGGFTVVELLIVIVVIAILSTISVVTYQGMIRKTQTASLKTDIQEMDKAQKYYILKNNSQALPVTPDGIVSNVLVFSSNPGNTVIVRLIPGSDDYCIYGYNEKSDYPSAAEALIHSSGSANCSSLAQAVPAPETNPTTPSAAYSTVAIIAQRIEAFRAKTGYYPKTSNMRDIGLTVKPNSDNANQQQLYCRNDERAIYLQIDKANTIVYVYETINKTISQPTNLPKLSLKNICPDFGIYPASPGYESTGIKDPNL